MGDVVGLQDGQLINNQEFVCDLARFSENLLTEKFIRRKYGKLDDATWERLGGDDALVEKIEEEKVRRMRDGSSKREKSQQLIMKGPAILDSIASDVSASPRHRVDAIKTLDSFTTNPQQGAPASDRFIITINLGADHVEHYNKSISINADDVVPDDVVATPQRSLPVANKRWDDDGHSNDVVAAPAIEHESGKKPVKTLVKKPVEHQSAVVEERKTAEQIALESMMRY
jgi:hypothetical protein